MKNSINKLVHNLELACELAARQQKEIDRLKNELHGKVEYIQEQREVIDEKKAEIERLQKHLNMNREELSLSKKLNIQTNDLNLRLLEECKTAKSEAIREFAKKLKNAALSIQLGEKYEYEVVTKQAIDHFVKEMTEGENG